MKTYFVISRNSAKELVGVVCAEDWGGEPATLEDTSAIIGEIKDTGTASLLDALRDGDLQPRVFRTRKEVREAVRRHSNLPSPFTFHVASFGEALERKSMPVLGWVIMAKSVDVEGSDVRSQFNEPTPGDEATDFVKTYDGWAFKTRNLARQYIKRHELTSERTGLAYRVEPLYARGVGYRVMYTRSDRSLVPSMANNPYDGATIEVNHAHLFKGDTDANYLFPTKEAARAAVREDKTYTIQRVPY